MKQSIVMLLLVAFISCKETPKKAAVAEEVPVETAPEKSYPEALIKIFETHGGLNNWKAKRTLAYTMGGERAETHTIDLWDRRDKVEGKAFTMGFDGEQVWLQDPDKAYKGDPIFYHNLIFYFYAMPFVLADDGIHYGDTEDLVVDGVSYPGISISYGEGVGTSPKDEYFIHYDPETHQMAWLGYTVTYRTGEKSERVSWINYNDWTTLDDVVLPQSITWHLYEGREIKEARNTLAFENMSVSTTAKSDAFYAKPEGGDFVQKKTQE